MAKRVAERVAAEPATVEDGEVDSVPALEVVASTGAGSGGAVDHVSAPAFDQQRLDYWRKALAKVDELADQPLASADVLLTAELLLANKLTSTTHLVELNAEDLRNPNRDRYLPVHLGLAKRAVRAYTSASLQTRLEKEGQWRASVTPPSDASVDKVSADRLVELLQKSVGDGGAAAKPKGKHKLDLKAKLSQVDLTEDLPQIGAPQQELADRLAEAVAKQPGVVTYVDLRFDSRPYWAPKEGEDDDLGEEDENSLQAFARAIAQANKGQKKKQSEVFLRWNVWASAFQVSSHISTAFLVLIRCCMCVFVCACFGAFIVSCMGWLPLPRDSSHMVWWLGISVRC